MTGAADPARPSKPGRAGRNQDWPQGSRSVPVPFRVWFGFLFGPLTQTVYAAGWSRPQRPRVLPARDGRGQARRVDAEADQADAAQPGGRRLWGGAQRPRGPARRGAPTWPAGPARDTRREAPRERPGPLGPARRSREEDPARLVARPTSVGAAATGPGDCNAGWRGGHARGDRRYRGRRGRPARPRRRGAAGLA